ncbi:MAG: hypothetical protein KAS57_08595 [Gammaproteobacteria bacterium]|nr:hypothetical protein [Gammaproteobacteria bacterium]
MRSLDFRALFLSFLCLNSSSAFSAAGDIISNTATIDFVYQGIPLIQESSPTGNTLTGVGNGMPTSFTEDRLINFSVVSTDAAAINVSSLQSIAFLTFTVTNSGNAVQDFLLTAVNTSPSPFVANVDSFDPVSPLQVFVEEGSNAGYLLAEDTALFIDDLVVGATATVYVVATMPVTIVGDAAAVALVAQVAEGGAAGQGVVITNDNNGFISPAGVYSNGGVSVLAGTSNSIANTPGLETVFNDPAALNPEDVDSNAVQDIRANGQHSDTGVFLVQAVAVPFLALNKTVTVIDTLGGTDPHAGATLRYQIDVVIGGVININNLVITDAVPANTTYVASSLLLNGAVQTDTADAPTDYSEFNGNDIVVDLSQGGTVSVAPATPNLITFDVTID